MDPRSGAVRLHHVDEQVLQRAMRQAVVRAGMANMIKDGETRIQEIVAVSADSILSPCGRCGEMMLQVNQGNADADVIRSESKTVKLSSLLPEHWLSAPKPKLGGAGDADSRRQ